MRTMRSAPNTILGKRPHQPDICSPTCNRQLQTPEATPKRSRTSICLALDDDGNKENVPPLPFENAPRSPPATRRARRRTTTGLETPTHPRIYTKRQTSTLGISTQAPETPTASRIITPPLTPPTPPPCSPSSLPSRARALLRPTCDGSSQIAGRDEERETVTKFMDSFSNEDAPTTLYISGPPGSGKTALINDVIRGLKETDIKLINLNCMNLKGVDALWQQLLEELDNKKHRSKSSSPKEEVERILKSLKTKCMLVLDELDHIAHSSSSLISLLSFPKSVSKVLRVIGIANTHTLTSSSSDSAETSYIKTLHFAPYTSQQLLAILQSRLAPIFDGKQKEEAAKFLPRPTLSLLTTKVAAMTGDVRAVMEVLRGAIGRAVAASTPIDPSSESIKSSTPTVTLPDVLAALRAYAPASTASKTISTVSSSEIVTKVKNLGLQARLIVLVVLLATRRLESGLPLLLSATSPSKSPSKRSSAPNPASSPAVATIDVSQLHGFYTSVLARSENGVFSPMGRSEFGDLLTMLETVGLVTLSALSGPSSPTKGGKRTLSRSLSFGSSKAQGQGQDLKLAADVRQDEILRGLGVSDEAEASNINEEMKAFWDTEVARMGKEVKGQKGQKDKAKAPDVADVLADAKKDK